MSDGLDQLPNDSDHFEVGSIREKFHKSHGNTPSACPANSFMTKTLCAGQCEVNAIAEVVFIAAALQNTIATLVEKAKLSLSAADQFCKQDSLHLKEKVNSPPDLHGQCDLRPHEVLGLVAPPKLSQQHF